MRNPSTPHRKTEPDNEKVLCSPACYFPVQFNSRRFCRGQNLSLWPDGKGFDASQHFFTETLGFELSGVDDDYPSVAVYNGDILITLWQSSDPDNTAQFDRKNNVGLHHLAFNVGSFEEMDSLYQHLRTNPDVTIEFSPEPLSGGPTKHMMIREPSGNRLEFIHQPPRY